MNVDYESLNELFRRQDFLGLIAMGVPEDEYEAEVHDILAVIDKLPREKASIPRLVGIFEDVYRTKFGWDDAEFRKFRPDFEDIARNVMNYFG
jgi:hypothetical protein